MRKSRVSHGLSGTAPAAFPLFSPGVAAESVAAPCPAELFQPVCRADKVGMEKIQQDDKGGKAATAAAELAQRHSLAARWACSGSRGGFSRRLVVGCVHGVPIGIAQLFAVRQGGGNGVPFAGGRGLPIPFCCAISLFTSPQNDD